MGNRAILLGVLGAFLFGCTPAQSHWAPAGSGDGTDIAAPEPLVCSGACVTMAPATFTGPSLFWFGAPDLMPSCPPETPLAGIEGYLDNPSPWFARECLITPTDACAEEGETCAPVPADDYQLCVHHADKVDCHDDYPDRRTMLDTESGADITVCCMPAVVP